MCNLFLAAVSIYSRRHMQEEIVMAHTALASKFNKPAEKLEAAPHLDA